MMTTLLHKYSEHHLRQSRVARHLQYFRDVGPSYIVTKPTWTMRIRLWDFGELSVTTRNWVKGSLVGG